MQFDNIQKMVKANGHVIYPASDMFHDIIAFRVLGTWVGINYNRYLKENTIEF